MIYLCKNDCGRLWAPYPTARAVVRAPSRTCPDCKEPEQDRQPRSRRRGRK